MNEDPDYVTRHRQYQHEWYVRNQEKVKQRARDYYQRHREEILARWRKNPPRAVNYQSQKSPEHRHRYYSEILAERLLRKKIQTFQAISGLARPKCATCGESDIRVLTANHLNGGGSSELKGPTGVDGFRQAIISGSRAVDDLNVLCFNCNIRYEYERGQRRLPPNWESVLDEEADVYGRDIRPESIR